MFPMPDFGAMMEDIVSSAITWLDMMNADQFFTVLLAFSLSIAAVGWVLNIIKKPPKLDG